MSDSPDLDPQNPLRRSYKTLNEAVDKKERKKAYSSHFTTVYNIFFQALPDQLKASSKGCVFAISDNEETLISGNSYGNISIINRKSKEILYEKLAFSSKALKLLVENGHLCCVVAGLNSIIILEKNTLENELSLEGHTGQVSDIIIHQNKLYSTGEDFTVQSWDTTNWTSLKTLFKMDCKGNCLDISPDGKFLVCGNSSKSIILYEFAKNETFSIQSEINQEIYAVKFAESFKYLATSGNAGKIEIWNTGFWDLNFYIDIGSIGTSLKFIRNNEFIVAGCKDGLVRCWRLFDQKLFSLENHKGKITSFYVSKSEKFIISSAEDRVFLTTKIPDLQEEVLHGHKSTINYIFYSKENDLIISAQDNGIIIFWNSVKKSMVKEVDYNCNFTSIIICPDETCLVCATNDCRIFIINLDSYEVDNLTIREKYEISAMSITPNSEILTIGNVLGQLKLINFNDLSEIKCIKKMSLGITSIDCDNKYFYAGSLDGKVLMENLQDESDFYVFPGKSPITCLSLSPCRKRLYAGSGNNLNIWSTKIKEKLTVIEIGAEVKKIYFKYHDYFMTFTNNSIAKVWSQRDYTLISSMSLNSNTKAIVLSQKERFMITAQNNHLLINSNPLFSDSISVIGEEKHKPEFMKYLVSITEQTSKTHKLELDSYLIAPYFINALHFYAYYNMKDHLLEALNNGSPLFTSKYGYSPLTISLDLMHDDCTIILLNHIRKALKENIHSGYLLENSLLEINLRGFSNINKLYDSMLPTCDYKNLPKFCNAFSKLPAIIHSKYIEISPNKYPINFKNKDISICFQQSTTRFSLENGSVESMNFISSLIQSPNNRVFNSEVVKYILHEKWRIVRWSLYIHALVYIHYLALLSTYAVAFQNDTWFASLVFFANCVLILPEIYKILTTRLGYWFSVMNNVDIWRFIMCTLYCSYVFKGIDDEYTKSWLILLVLFSWIKGIGLFALFDKTRFLVNMIRTVIIEMMAFFIVLAYSTLAFAFFEHAIEDSDTSDEFFDYLLDAYMFTLGDFGDHEYSNSEWIIVIAVSILNSMILLNFLISIIFDTFGRVQEERDAIGQRELAKIILEGESIQFWKRKSKLKYLQVCKSNFGDIDEESDKLKKYRKEILNAVKETNEEVKTSKGEIMEYVQRNKIESENDLQKNFEILEKRLMESMEKKFGEIMEKIEKRG